MHSFRDPTEVVVEAGQAFEIVLEGNFTTGYRWELQQQEGISLISEEMRPGGTAPGSAGTQHFQFKAVSRGSYSLEFSYRRPWEDARADERRIVLQVE